MRITYAICVCNEARELLSLLNFLTRVKDPEDDISILLDSNKVTQGVRDVLEQFKEVQTHERPICGNFSNHRNYHLYHCKGDYIFVIDADEMPQEHLIKTIKQSCAQGDLIFVPRINICPGYTEEFLKFHTFTVNEIGWINWPDYQGRVFKNGLRWSKGLHEKIEGAKKPIGLEANPKNALWHVKSVEVQNKARMLYDTL